MAAAGKKSKKPKWIRAHITDIIAEPTTIPTINSWADSVDEEPEPGSGYRRQHAPIVLPSASRAARGGLAVDDESIPKRPPFIAKISNLPYDVEECEISKLFSGLKVSSLRLPREGDRLKGYGYVDFEDRESLIDALNIADLSVSGRRVRIEVAPQDDRRMGRSGRSDREYDPERTMGDWRAGPRAAPESQSGGGGGGGAPVRRTMDREGMRERDRERDSSADNRPGGWRDGDRPQPPEPARTPYGGRDSFGRDRYGEDRGRERGYGGRDGFRPAEREGGFSRDRGFGSRGFGDRDSDPPTREEMKPRERPKLNLLPRTVPRETEAPTKPADGAPLDEKSEKPVPKPVPAEKVFGGAKPVDTAAKEREIEERLRKQEEEARKAAEEKEVWGRKSDHSSDRRGGGTARRDGRDSRSYNRDRRDYKDDKDRRDYSKDDKDRRDYDRGRHDYSKDVRREYNRDDRDRRDYSKERDYSPRRDHSRDKDRRDSPERVRRDYSGDREKRDYSGDRQSRDYSGDREKRGYSGEREKRDYSKEKRDGSDREKRDVPKSERSHSDDRREPRDASGDRGRENKQEERNGTRPSRSRDRRDNIDEPPLLPKIKEPEKPNFVASNQFSFLEGAEEADTD